jgi:hypothetical protein
LKTLCVVLLLSAGAAWSADVLVKPTATTSYVVRAASGVLIRHNGENGWRAAVPGAMLMAGSSVMTRPGVTAQLKVGNRAYVHVAAGSTVTLPYSRDNVDPCWRVVVERGTAWTTVAKGLRGRDIFQVESAHAVGRVRGTQFKTSVSGVDTQWEMLEGRLSVRQLPSGQEKTVEVGTKAVVAGQGTGGVKTMAFAGFGEARRQFAGSFGSELPSPAGASGEITTPGGVKIVPFIGAPPSTPPFTIPPGVTGVKLPPTNVLVPIAPVKPGVGAVLDKGAVTAPTKGVVVDTGTRGGVTRGGSVGAVGTDSRLVESGLVDFGAVGGGGRTPVGAGGLRGAGRDATGPVRGITPGVSLPGGFPGGGLPGGRTPIVPVQPIRDFDRRIGGLDRPGSFGRGMGGPTRIGR